MMPTLGRKPSEPITAYNLANACRGSAPQKREKQKARREAITPPAQGASAHCRSCNTRDNPAMLRPPSSREECRVRLALFDLDNTLLAGDSDHAWGEFLCQRGLVDA